MSNDFRRQREKKIKSVNEFVFSLEALRYEINDEPELPLLDWEGNGPGLGKSEESVFADVEFDPDRDGPQMRTVASSDTLASICGWRGFQATQFTVRVCPLKTATGFSRLMCQM